MHIQCLSFEALHGFIDCYIRVFESLYGILPDAYVAKQLDEASGKEFYDKMIEGLTNVNSIMLVAIDDGVKGIAWGRVADGSSWLAFMGVEPCSRRKGLGSALLNGFTYLSKKKGAKKIRLNTHPGLIAAINLYERAGFVKEGPIVNPHGLELILYSKEI